MQAKAATDPAGLSRQTALPENCRSVPRQSFPFCPAKVGRRGYLQLKFCPRIVSEQTRQMTTYAALATTADIEYCDGR